MQNTRNNTIRILSQNVAVRIGYHPSGLQPGMPSGNLQEGFPIENEKIVKRRSSSSKLGRGNGASVAPHTAGSHAIGESVMTRE